MNILENKRQRRILAAALILSLLGWWVSDLLSDSVRTPATYKELVMERGNDSGHDQIVVPQPGHGSCN